MLQSPWDLLRTVVMGVFLARVSILKLVGVAPMVMLRSTYALRLVGELVSSLLAPLTAALAPLHLLSVVPLMLVLSVHVTVRKLQ